MFKYNNLLTPFAFSLCDAAPGMADKLDDVTVVGVLQWGGVLSCPSSTNPDANSAPTRSDAKHNKGLMTALNAGVKIIP